MLVEACKGIASRRGPRRGMVTHSTCGNAAGHFRCNRELAAYSGERSVVDWHDQLGCSVRPLQTGNLRGNVVKLDEVHVFASPMSRDLEQIGYAREAAFARETRCNLFERNRNDGIDFDLTFAEVVSLADTNVRTHPDANASRDRTTSHAITQVFREKHRASLARCFPPARTLLPFGGLTAHASWQKLAPGSHDLDS